MTQFSTRFATWGCGRSLTWLLVGRVRCWGPMGGRGVRLKARLQHFHLLAEPCQFVMECVDIGLDRCGGVRPVLRLKGKRPDGLGGSRLWVHDVSKRQTTKSDCWTFYSGEMRLGPEENARGAGHRAPANPATTSLPPVGT